jgi:hypothetical protein
MIFITGESGSEKIFCHREHRGHIEKYMNVKTLPMSAYSYSYTTDPGSCKGFICTSVVSVPSVAIIFNG